MDELEKETEGMGAKNVPEVGKVYHVFDDGKITLMRHFLVKCKEVIPFDVPVFKDPKEICHPHTLFYNGNRYVIDIMPNNDDPTHKDNYRAVIRRCNGPESPVFVYGEVLAFYQEK